MTRNSFKLKKPMATNEKKISPLLDKNSVTVKTVPYTDPEKEYFWQVVKKIYNAQQERDQQHDEFDGMTYLEYCADNRKGANTYLEPKKNKADTNYASGTIRQKMLTYLASIMSLDLGIDINAYDEDSREIKELGEAMEDILFTVGENDGEGGDDEKKLLRFYTMFEQGSAFVREMVAKKYKLKKRITKKFDGKISSAEWSKRMMATGPQITRKIILNENVILGNIREFDMENQPFVVDIEIMPYDMAKEIYGTWERWEYVPKTFNDMFMLNRDAQQRYNPFKWYRTETSEDVEIVRYQSLPHNECMIFINGVMMLPVGMPMWQEGYDIAKQVNEVISPFFAYGKSMVSRLRNNSILMDEMIRLAIKKTQKSFAPPMISTAGRALSQRIFSPGVITTNIKEGTISRLDPNAGSVEAGEFNMIQFLQNKIDEKSVNPVFGGQQPSGTPTATQILEVQRQARMVISLTVLVCSLLERKLAWLRLFNVLQHYFKPQKMIYNKYTNEFIQKYRTIVRDKFIPGVGMGKQMIKIAEKIPTVNEQIDEENALSTKEEPVRITYIDPKYIAAAKLMWYVNVVQKEKKSDALNKVLFNEFSQGAMQFPNVNIQHLEERYAEVWEENPAKLFNRKESPTPEQMPGQQASQPSNLAGVPQTPTPERNKSTLLQLAGKEM